MDTFKTELIKDRIWKTRGQMELAILEYVHWFNHDRLHESLGDLNVKQRAIDRTAHRAPVGRYRPPDSLLAFLTGL